MARLLDTQKCFIRALPHLDNGADEARDPVERWQVGSYAQPEPIIRFCAFLSIMWRPVAGRHARLCLSTGSRAGRGWFCGSGSRVFDGVLGDPENLHFIRSSSLKGGSKSCRG